MLENKEGQRVPEVTFRTRSGHDWREVTSAQIFDGKTVIVFSLPGAFTPTCSSSHVPRYNQLAPVFQENGVDEIVCVSVNDAFVMNEWKVSQQADAINFLPDGNGDFSRGMGMLVHKQDLGFGDRSWRYSMLVKNGTIDKMFIEADVPGDPFDVSDADTMLNYIAPRSPAPLDAAVFARHGCPHCARAKRLLNEAGISFDALELNTHYSYQTLRAVSGEGTFPQVFLSGRHIGGADELEAWLASRNAD